MSRAIIICTAFVRGSLIILLLFCLEGFSPPVVGKEVQKKTQVRIIGSPQGTFRTITTTRLRRIEVRVKNTGDVSAEKVFVEATSPNGSTYHLYGPSTLDPNSDASYSDSMDEIVTKDTKIQARATCGNCYR